MLCLPPGLAKCRQQSFHIAASLGDAKQCCSLLSPAHIPSESFARITSGTKRLKVCGHYSDLAPGGPLTFPQEIPIKPWIKSHLTPHPFAFFVLFYFLSVLSFPCGSLKAGTVINWRFPKQLLPHITDQHLRETAWWLSPFLGVCLRSTPAPLQHPLLFSPAPRYWVMDSWPTSYPGESVLTHLWRMLVVMVL